MLVGVVAFNTLKVIAPEEPRALGVLLTGYIFQGMYSGAVRSGILTILGRSRLLHDLLLYLHLHPSVSIDRLQRRILFLTLGCVAS